MTSPGLLKVSVIIPVYNSEGTIGRCLAALRASSFRDFECLVVDDGSTDRTREIAAGAEGVRVIDSGGRLGPAKARNIGVRESGGEILVFLDADVAIHVHSLESMVRHFAEDPGLAAVMGSYDRAPGHPSFLSGYRNLLHAYYHTTGRRMASTFWAGCGAIRRTAFDAAGGFSESFERPSIEDIELGYRLRRAGQRILLDPEIQAKHLKVWTLSSMIRTDLWDRAVPWTELILRERHMPDDLNVSRWQRVCVTLAYIALACGVIDAIQTDAFHAVLIGVLLFLLLGPYWLRPGPEPKEANLRVLCALMGMLALTYAHPMQQVVWEMLLAGVALFSIRAWISQRLWWRRWTGAVYGLYLLGCGAVISTAFQASPFVWIATACVVAIMLINLPLYRFLAVHWGILHALAAVPFHFTYFLYSGLGFGWGVLRHLLSTAAPPRTPQL